MPRPKGRKDELFYGGKYSKSKSQNVPTKVRTGGRVKKAKIVFDPSENNMPKRQGRSKSLGFNFGPKSGDVIYPGPKTRKQKTIISSEQLPENSQTSDRSDRSRSPPILIPQVNDSCMICNKTDIKKPKKLVSCKDCHYKVHMDCLKIHFQNQNLLEEHWRCDNCRTCVVCYETSEAGSLITCCVCVDAYHLSCHNPKLPNKLFNKFKWECTKCQNINTDVPSSVKDSLNNQSEFNISIEESPKSTAVDLSSEINTPIVEDKNIVSTELKTEEIPVKTVEKVKDIPKPPKLISNRIDDIIPDISDWSCEKLFHYIKRHFPNEAHVFREQEIDGPSLLLMKRSDVIQGLPFKLGPAIRLYSFIVKLQTQTNDPRSTWM